MTTHSPEQAPGLPPPLVPASVDLRSYNDMPLDISRLKGSELSADVPPEICWAALLLWMSAWHQVPAASIPDNDDWQALQCGYRIRGRTDPEWPTVRTLVLRNFVKCSDGRLYHTTLSKKALESWTSKVKFGYDRMCERLRKKNKALAESGRLVLEIPTIEEWVSAGMPHDPHGTSDGNSAEKRLKGSEGKGSEVKGTSKRSSGGKPPAGKPDAEAVSKPTWEAYAGAYRERYKVEPLRNAAVNSKLKQFVAKVGAEHAPAVAAFYLTHKQALYVSAKHAVDLLLRDAERLYTDWQTDNRGGAPAGAGSSHDLHSKAYAEGTSDGRLI